MLRRKNISCENESSIGIELSPSVHLILNNRESYHKCKYTNFRKRVFLPQDGWKV